MNGQVERKQFSQRHRGIRRTEVVARVMEGKQNDKWGQREKTFTGRATTSSPSQKGRRVFKIYIL